MTLERRWAKQLHKMLSTRNKNPSKPGQRPTDGTVMLLAQHGCELEKESNEMDLDSGLTRALELTTSKIMASINDKLDPLTKIVLSHTSELKTATDNWMRWRQGPYSSKSLSCKLTRY